MSRKMTIGASLLFGLAVLVADASPSNSQSANGVHAKLVRQDFSDCTNSNVRDSDSALIGGELLITRKTEETSIVTVTYTKAAPNTLYHVFLKCYTMLGDVQTDAQGQGSNTFSFRTIDVGSIFAFDSYPDGAPLGNKYQSTQVNFAR
jgi:hypothetical protein